MRNASEAEINDLLDLLTSEKMLVNTDDESVMRMGDALWMVFSNNSVVTSPDEVVYDLGSWRHAGTIISEYLNKKFGLNTDYMNFYCSFRSPYESKVRDFLLSRGYKIEYWGDSYLQSGVFDY